MLVVTLRALRYNDLGCPQWANGKLQLLQLVDTPNDLLLGKYDMSDSDDQWKFSMAYGDQRLSEVLRALESSNVGSNSVVGATPSFWSPNLAFLDDESRKKLTQLQNEIERLRRKLDEESQALQKEKTASKEYANQIVQLQQTHSEILKIERFGTLLKCVNKEGYRHLLESEAFQQLFLGETECQSFVMSIDIRRSTELMLKARSAEAFASFTTQLCSDLMEIIKDSYGVIDKFTGDIKSIWFRCELSAY